MDQHTQHFTGGHDNCYQERSKTGFLVGQHIQHATSIGKYQDYITVQFQALVHRWRVLYVLIHQKTCLAYASLNVIHIETYFIEIKILASVDSGPKIHTRMPRAFERAPT